MSNSTTKFVPVPATLEELEERLLDEAPTFNKSEFFPDHPMHSITRIEDHPMNKSGSFLEVLIYMVQKRKEIAEAVDRGEITAERAEQLREDLKRPFTKADVDTVPEKD